MALKRLYGPYNTAFGTIMEYLRRSCWFMYLIGIRIAYLKRASGAYTALG